MMARHSVLRATGVVSIFGAAGPALDEIGLSAWIAQAEPGETLVYHCGFLAVDTFGSASPLSPERRSTLRRTADAALRAAEQGLVHLVQARIGPDQFAYIAVARGVCQTSCPLFSCSVSDFRGADFGFWVEPDGANRLPVAGFA